MKKNLNLFSVDTYNDQIIIKNGSIFQDDKLVLELSGSGQADLWLYLETDSDREIVLFFEFLIIINSDNFYTIPILFTISIF